MKIYLNQNVFDAALDRIRYIFREFPIVIVSTSGGKDSTVVLNLALRIAEELDRLPLKVMFIDQECEWDLVIAYMRRLMSDPRVEPLWLQVPIKIFNATSTLEPWLYCWEENAEEKWIRHKEPESIKINRYGTDRFKELFEAYLNVEYVDQKACLLGGVRTEESPGRLVGLTSSAVYQHITWGNKRSGRKNHYSLYPLYDWSYSDIWKAIHEYEWDYCKIYDYMYQYGVPVRDMRVSNVHHETAIRALYYLQEIESDNWNLIIKRISGISTAGHLNKDGFICPQNLPYMFKSWKEYRDYLLENLITDIVNRETFRKQFVRYDADYVEEIQEKLSKVEIASILTNDYHETKLKMFSSSSFGKRYVRFFKVKHESS